MPRGPWVWRRDSLPLIPTVATVRILVQTRLRSLLTSLGSVPFFLVPKFHSFSFLRTLFGQLNAGRRERLAQELEVLRPLPATRLNR